MGKELGRRKAERWRGISGTRKERKAREKEPGRGKEEKEQKPMWWHRYAMRAHRLWFVPQGIKFVGFNRPSPHGIMFVHVDGTRPLPENGPVSGSVDLQRLNRFDADGRLV